MAEVPNDAPQLKPFRFTKENASEFARKSRRVIAERLAELQEAADIVKAFKDSQRTASGIAVDEYTLARLGRVRKQLDRLDKWMLAEPDAAKMERLAGAQARVAEQERQLSGRSMPPNQKPVAPKPAKRNQDTQAGDDPLPAT